MFEITLDKKSKRTLRDIQKVWPARMERGQALFLLELATVLRQEVIQAGKKAPGRNNKPYGYAKKLKVSLIEGIADATAAVAVWLDRNPEELKAQDMLKTVLMIYPKPSAKAWVHALSTYGVWPADLLPAPIPKGAAKVIARRVRGEEAQRLRDHFLDHRDQIERALSEAEAPKYRLASGVAAAGTRVYVDLAWEILRAEFGFDEHRKDMHWRPAIDAMVARMSIALEHLSKYMVDGNERWFDVQEDPAVSWKQVKSGVAFQRQLMPFVKRKVK